MEIKRYFLVFQILHTWQKDNGTGANGQSVTYTGISTTHKFTKTGKEAKAVVVEISGDKIDSSNFFETVQTPDTVKVKSE